ncbi:hypothetical protein CMU15_00450 [Elizabethkingia anophelis]|nr:hypothetical protein [Elizabethkingia anophelis]
MKTKYVKVPVSDRLPEKGINSILLWNENPELVAKGYVSKFGNLIIHGNVDYEGKPDLYLEEVPDHSEEMISLLEKIIIHSKIDESHDYNLINKAKQLINKVKDNGKI